MVQEPGERSGQVEHMLSGFELNLTAISMISLLVGVFLIYNTVTASVVRRRGEVGILRALGASRAKVRWLFLGEAALYGIIGSVAGCRRRVMANFLVRSFQDGDKSIRVDHHRSFLSPFLANTGGGVGGPGNGFRRRVSSGQCRREPVTVTRFERRRSHRASEKPRALGHPERRMPAGGVWRQQASAGRLSHCRVRGGFLHFDRVLSPFALRDPPVSARGRAKFSEIRFSRGWLLGIMVRSLYRHAITIAALASALAMLVSVSIMIYSFRKTIDRWLERRLAADLFVAPSANEIVGFENFVSKDFLGIFAIAPAGRDDRYFPGTDGVGER